MTLTLEDMSVEEFEAFRGMSVQNYETKHKIGNLDRKRGIRKIGAGI